MWNGSDQSYREIPFYVAVGIIAALSIFWFHRSTRSRGNSERLNSKDGEAEVSSPPSAPPPVREDGFQYHVFLSFRGPDTRKGFTDLLYEALQDKGIVTFIDNDNLEKGKRVEELFGHIERSKIFVPIFSKGYADSEWCLKEITKIVECKRLTIPVFIDVEPRDVRHQTGPFAPAFRRHLKNNKIEKEEVSKWSSALTEAGKISGYTFATTNGYWGKLIQVIVKRILTEVNKAPLFVAKHLVGLDSRIADLMELLDVESSDDARMVGIHGMGGMGKTTLAKAVYNQISSSFDARSFISNVREAAKQSSGLMSLQKQLLHDVFKDEKVKVSSISDGTGKIKERIRGKKVLLVLDDIDNKSQLDALAGDLDWFCFGSRIIVTTRDKHVLRAQRVKQNEVYELRELDVTQSFQLFSWHAFGKEVPDTKFIDLSKEVTSIAAGLPLALEIFGSHFFDLKTDREWQSMLQKLKDAQDKGLHETLKISYDALDENEKDIFLDIACFFVGQQRELPTLMWEACRSFPDITVKFLMHKSLVSVNDDTGQFEMHDHIRDMGRTIVQAESKELGKRSRLWKEEETLDVLQNRRGMENIEAIQFFCKNLGPVIVDAESFAAMSQLRMLQLGDVTLKGGYEHFPRMLRWLEWSPHDLDSLPGALHLENLVILDLTWSSITQLWNQKGFAGIKVLGELKVLNLNHCEDLATCPDFRSMPHLETLDFSYCEKITELHPSIGCLKSLSHLCLRRCRSLKELPQEIWQLTSLEELDLSHCYQVTTLPAHVGDLMPLKQPFFDKLKVLDLRYCNNLTVCPDFTSIPHLEALHLDDCYKMSELHPSVGLLKSLTRLNLSHCTSLRELPQEVWQLTSLKELNLSYCFEITNLSSHLWDSKLLSSQHLLDKLETLDLRDCGNLTICPDFRSMPHLKTLYFTSCKSMSGLHPSIGYLKSLTHLDLSGCRSLKALPHELWQLESLEKLSLGVCSQIITLPSQLGNGKLLYRLTALDLSHCGSLTSCPDFASMPHLETLRFDGCEKMTKLHPSIGLLKSLTHLSLRECTSIKKLPPEIWQLTSVEVLDASDCCQIITLPPQLGDLKSLRQLFLGGTSITTLPEAVGRLKQLKFLSVRNCSLLREIPECICSLHNLQELDAANCECLASLPNLLGNLKSLLKLNLSRTAIEELPDSIVSLEKLGFLSVAHCNRLKFLPTSASFGSTLLKSYGVPSTSGDRPRHSERPSVGDKPSERQHLSLPQFPPSLTKLNASGCYELEMIANVSRAKELQALNLSGCRKLVDVPGVEQLKWLETLKIRGCRSLSNSLRKKIQEANFERLGDFSIPGCLGESPDAQISLTFFLPMWFDTGRLCLKVGESGLDSVVVCMDMATDDGHLFFQTLVQPSPSRPNDCIEDDDEVPKMELGEYVKAMRDDAQWIRRKMMMRVSICGRLLLDGYYRSKSYRGYHYMRYDPDGGAHADISGQQSNCYVVLGLNFRSPRRTRTCKS